MQEGIGIPMAITVPFAFSGIMPLVIRQTTNNSFRDNDVEILQWSESSPDLNPIENAEEITKRLGVREPGVFLTSPNGCHVLHLMHGYRPELSLLFS